MLINSDATLEQAVGHQVKEWADVVILANFV